MAIVLEANYSKKLGLPGYSSHQYSVTLRTEVADLSQVEAESTRLHAMLQASVDREIQKTGFLPPNSGSAAGSGSSRQGNINGRAEAWACSEKQQSLIQKIVSENNLDKSEVEGLANERFGKGVKALNKLEASGLIEELLEKTGQSKGNGRSRYQNRYPQRAAG
jgi:hypothetical protein